MVLRYFFQKERQTIKKKIENELTFFSKLLKFSIILYINTVEYIWTKPGFYFFFAISAKYLCVSRTNRYQLHHQFAFEGDMS